VSRRGQNPPSGFGHTAHLRLWLLLGLAATVLALWSSTQVGLGWDEPEYIRAGTAYTYWFTNAPDPLSDQSIRDFWTWQHTHPPFGQLLAGIMVRLLAGLALPLLPTLDIITAARIAAALCFGGTVALLAGWCERELGTRTAFVAGVSLVLFPRVFGAAQFVSLDVPMMFTWLLTVVAWEWALRSAPPGMNLRADFGEPFGPELKAKGLSRAVLTPRALLAAGALGLALLTKLNALFLPVLLWPWALLRYRRRALGPILASLLLAPLLFFAGWPWLYHDTVTRASDYLLDKMGRPVLPVYYLGRAYVEQYAPWHYPLVMVAVTVPAGLLAASVIGLAVARKGKPRTAVKELALVNLAAILGVAMLPWAPKYDGVRLFLPAFPFLAVLAGVGVEAMFRRAGNPPIGGWRRVGWAAVVGFLLTQGVGLLWAWPFHLTYYNMFVGGLRGAERLGFESIYWGEAFDPEAWAALDQLVPDPPIGGLARAAGLGPYQTERLRRGWSSGQGASRPSEVAPPRPARVAFVGVAKDVPEFLQRYGYLGHGFVPLGPSAAADDVDYVVVGRREGSLAREGWSGALEPRVLAKALFVREHHGVPLCWIVRADDVH
jgi:4-amino-4-deoxy-L-arabinose transferase-like glycosyltransferase